MDLSDNEENNCKCARIVYKDNFDFLFLAKSPSDRTASKYMKIIFFETFILILVVRTTRADPRHHRKHIHHRHQSSQQHFDDADERSHKDNSNSSPLINGENKSQSQTTPMIDVNLITDLLIQHSQSTGFEKSLEMLTQTLRQQLLLLNYLINFHNQIHLKI
jgi:hypothetical protein